MLIPNDGLAQVKALYEAGLYARAHECAQPFGLLRDWKGASARVLAGRLATKLGAPRLGTWLFLQAFRGERSDAEAAVYFARTVMDRRGPWVAWRFLRTHVLSPLAPPEAVADWNAAIAVVAAAFRDFATAEEHLQRAGQLNGDHAWIGCARADVLVMRDRHEEALAATREAIAGRPSFAPALQRAAHLLCALGRYEEALALLTDAEGLLESGDISQQRAQILFHLRRWDEAARSVERCEARYLLAEPEVRSWLRGAGSDVACGQGDMDRAIRLAEEADRPFHRAVRPALERARETGPSEDAVCLDVPFVQQHHFTCAPASLAAITRFWAKPIDHLELARAVTYQGTPGYKARAFMEAQGWVAREFRVTVEAAHELLSRGLPFTLVVVYPSSAHEQVVVGFDRRRGTALILDPGQPMRVEVLLAPLLAEQAPFGPRGLVLLPADAAARLAGIDLPDASVYDAVHQMEVALERHDRAGAEARCRALRAEHPDHLLTNRARRVLASYDGDERTVLECAEAMVARHPESIPLRLTRLGALHALGREADAARELAALHGDARQRPFFLERYAQELSHDARRLPEALVLAERVLRIRARDPHVLAIVANVLWRARRGEEALELYRLAACVEDKDEGLVGSYFGAARHFGRVEDAVQWLERRYRRLGSSSSYPVRSLFWALQELGRADEGFAFLEEALAACHDGDLLIHAADAYARWGREGRAEELLEQGRGQCRPAAWLRSSARLAFGRGQLAEALSSWKTIVASDPLDVDAHREIATLLATLEGDAAALGHVESAARQFEHHYRLQLLWYQLARRRNPEAGERVLRHILAVKPDDAWAWRELAMLLGESPRVDEALAALDRSAAIEPHHPAQFCVRGLVLGLAGRIEGARAAYQEAIRLDVNLTASIDELLGLPLTPAERRADLELVHAEIVRQVLRSEGVLSAYRRHARGVLEPESILAALRVAFEARKDLWPTWAAVAHQLRDMNRLEEATAQIRAACDEFPLVPALWHERAKLARLRGAGDEERSALENVVDMPEISGGAVQRLAALREESGDAAGARRLLERVVSRAPLDARSHSMLASLCWRTHDRAGARRALDRALGLAPGEARLWDMLQAWDREEGMPARALDRARALVRDRGGDAACWMALARLLDRRDLAEERLQALERAITLAPQVLEPHDLRAESLAQLGRFDEAVAACRPRAWGERIPRELRGRELWVEARRGRLDAAITGMRTLLDGEPDYFWGWGRLADWCLSARDLDGYRAAADALVRIAPHYAISLGYRADARRRKGDRAGAEADLRRALELDPVYRYARNELAKLLILKGDYDAALAVLDRYASASADPYEMYLRARIHRELGATAKAEEALARLFGAPAVDAEVVDAVFEISESREWNAALDRVLGRLCSGDEVPTPAARAWVRVAGRRYGLGTRKGLRRMRALPLGSAARHEAAREHMDQLAATRARWRLALFVGQHRRELRADTALWGRAGFMLVSLRLYRWTAWFLGDFRGRPEVESWMLYNLGLARRCLGRRSAHAVSVEAVALPEDQATSGHRLWLALDHAGAGEIAAATGHLDRVPRPPESEGYDLFAWTIASEGLKTLTGEQPFAAFRKAVEAAVAAYPGYSKRKDLVRAYLAVVRAVARRRGGVTGFFWSFGCYLESAGFY
jgi:tetratricopeptide (TPR) repeat protein